jgi:DivIVA domain-containing protein
MAKRPRPIILPRVLSRSEVAGYIGRSDTWFGEHRGELEARGFPKPLPIVGGYDKDAVDAWLDRIGGLEVQSEASFDDAWSRAAHG